ncbi:amidase [Halarsenatibacter silvermanii]|uniref:Asp-tRNAAsn/Glu-tRNAGln amidotransferase A subunit n=1 Tax=Halarsenatibacter silvermanii TaxID=321763 RepID=A0A1G9MYM3_9FIRM|nr:amidase [Halarsenatibacter silvermanii]SDL79416.1 Asp-tRNAAsn/Glu-tRNAGln amidotransferase A subunit [Halarsenatibacter silvermanii]
MEKYINSCRLNSLSDGLKEGEEDLSEIIDESLNRIENCEEKIEALLPEQNREKRLRRQADKLQRRAEAGEDLPLYGVLTGIKDIFHLQGFFTRAGSSLDPELLTGEEGYIVKKIRQAGGLMLGKTVTTEFAYFAPGPTRNPHNFDHTPGGSSSGSAAAVAAGYCPLALGTQTVGSIIRPASYCGVAGFKPTYDRIPREGLLPFSSSADHIGFFTRDVSGMRKASAVLVPGWEEDNEDLEYSPGAEKGKKPVLGVPADAYLEQADNEGLRNFAETKKELEQAGYPIKKTESLSDIAGINRAHRQLVAFEFAEVHRDWYEEYSDHYRQGSIQLIEKGRAVSSADYQRAQKSQQRTRKNLHEKMKTAGIDIWISPAAPGPAPEGIDDTGNPVMNLPWTHAGLPAISLPAGGSDEGLPMGLQLAGYAGGDEKLLAWAADIEKILL